MGPLLPAVSFAAAISLTEQTFHGRPAWVLENGAIRISVLKGGGHIAEVRQITGESRRDVNPMRIPHYPTIDPHTYDDERDNSRYGDDPHRWLSSGYMGHLLCFPWYGPPSSAEEIAAGLGNHGEAPIVAWRKIGGGSDAGVVTLRCTAELPKTHYRVERTLTMRSMVPWVRIEESVENLLPFDRPMQWMQHATFGPPFVEPGKSLLRISAIRGHRNGELPAGESPSERLMPVVAPGGSYTALLMDRSRDYQFFALSNPDYPVTIGYLFRTSDHPWAADWQENQRATHKPWDGKVIARGIEFGPSPYAEGLRKAVDRGSLFDTPSYRWIGARQKLRTDFIIFLSEKQVRDAHWVNHNVVVQEAQ
jgi:hypothetical protein